ncbi:hypothetical protein BDP27DRAFT_1427070 [Rhodocollybia butyracea]|uniref:Zinc finger PHD-type domain-containing protein n=1 Tax=Rhodocollybia butyracea TaxID=206335 RepID=A0A9P5U284_9AGAR|nr:hypothetical protein BDP27DRAFT_1427070 [Rhodocollybia butyracea]
MSWFTQLRKYIANAIYPNNPEAHSAPPVPPPATAFDTLPLFNENGIQIGFQRVPHNATAQLNMPPALGTLAGPPKIATSTSWPPTAPVVTAPQPRNWTEIPSFDLTNPALQTSFIPLDPQPPSETQLDQGVIATSLENLNGGEWDPGALATKGNSSYNGKGSIHSPDIAGGKPHSKCCRTTSAEDKRFTSTYSNRPKVTPTQLMVGPAAPEGFGPGAAELGQKFASQAYTGYRLRQEKKKNGNGPTSAFGTFEKLQQWKQKHPDATCKDLSAMTLFPLGGLLTDAAHKYWDDPNGRLIVTSIYSPLIQKWVPVLFSYANALLRWQLREASPSSDEHLVGVVDFSDPEQIGFQDAYCTYFLAQPNDPRLEEQLRAAAKKLLKGCLYHYLKAVERIAKMSTMVDPNTKSEFRALAASLPKLQTLAEFHDAVLQIRQKWPRASSWLNWWLNIDHAAMLFECMRAMPSHLASKLPETTNPEEAIHATIHRAVGKNHPFFAGLDGLLVVIKWYDSKYRMLSVYLLSINFYPLVDVSAAVGIKNHYGKSGQEAKARERRKGVMKETPHTGQGRLFLAYVALKKPIISPLRKRNHLAKSSTHHRSSHQLVNSESSTDSTYLLNLTHTQTHPHLLTPRLSMIQVQMHLLILQRAEYPDRGAAEAKHMSPSKLNAKSAESQFHAIQLSTMHELPGPAWTNNSCWLDSSMEALFCPMAFYGSLAEFKSIITTAEEDPSSPSPLYCFALALALFLPSGSLQKEITNIRDAFCKVLHETHTVEGKVGAYQMPLGCLTIFFQTTHQLVTFSNHTVCSSGNHSKGKVADLLAGAHPPCASGFTTFSAIYKLKGGVDAQQKFRVQQQVEIKNTLDINIENQPIPALDSPNWIPCSTSSKRSREYNFTSSGVPTKLFVDAPFPTLDGPSGDDFQLGDPTYLSDDSESITHLLLSTLENEFTSPAPVISTDSNLSISSSPLPSSPHHILCRCGVESNGYRESIEQMTVQCAICKNYTHTGCITMRFNGQIPKHFECDDCRFPEVQHVLRDGFAHFRNTLPGLRKQKLASIANRLFPGKGILVCQGGTYYYPARLIAWDKKLKTGTVEMWRVDGAMARSRWMSHNSVGSYIRPLEEQIHKQEAEDDLLVNPTTVRCSSEIAAVLQPHRVLLMELAINPEKFSLKQVPALALQKLQRPNQRKCYILHWGTIGYTDINMMLRPTIGHARTLVVAHLFRSEFMGDIEDGTLEQKVLEKAWKRLKDWTGRTNYWEAKAKKLFDVNFEAISLLDKIMFDESERAGAAGKPSTNAEMEKMKENLAWEKL